MAQELQCSFYKGKCVFHLTVYYSYLLLHAYTSIFRFLQVLGFVACRVTSKILGIGSAERSWGAVKHLKTDKRSHMSGPVTKQQATLFGAASIKASQARRNALENHPTAVRKLWSDEDLAFDLQLSAWGVDISSLASQKPARIFRAWLEQWEQDCLKKNDPIVDEVRKEVCVNCHWGNSSKLGRGGRWQRSTRGKPGH